MRRLSRLRRSVTLGALAVALAGVALVAQSFAPSAAHADPDDHGGPAIVSPTGATTAQDAIPVSNRPYVMALTANDATMYVGQTNGTIAVIDTASSQQVATWNVPNGEFPDSIAVGPDGLVYVGTGDSDSIYVFDTSGNVVSQLSIHDPYQMTISPNGDFIYVATYTSPAGVGVIDTATHTLVTTWTLPCRPQCGSAQAVAVSPDGNYVYLTYQAPAPTLVQFDTTTGQVIASAPYAGNGYSVTVADGGKRVFVGSDNTGTVYVFDASAGSLVLETTVKIPDGGNPDWVTSSPDGKRVYVADYSASSKSIWVIDATAATPDVVDDIEVGPRPLTVIIRHDDRFGYAALPGSNVVVPWGINSFAELVPTLPDGRLGEGYAEPTLANGNTNATFEVSDGQLPSGLTLGPDGVISGTPTEIGTFTFEITATSTVDGVTSIATQTYTVTITYSGAAVTLIKHVVGGSAKAADWTLYATPQAAGAAHVALPGSEEGTSAGVSAGVEYTLEEYDATEGATQSYGLTALQCNTGSGGANVSTTSFLLQPGQQIVCTFTNTYQAADAPGLVIADDNDPCNADNPVNGGTPGSGEASDSACLAPTGTDVGPTLGLAGGVLGAGALALGTAVLLRRRRA